ncbi:TetR/AcrR family transcriptional regulator [Amycolatopsis suaedae]|uniref:TetR/AcrR family transcriptional regulator n=1 Tax=Amycolatopsis suaedae TaxID=2510978 RepID=A0A4Q7J6G8_9PSEU|nr:TetR/AcrR family transcriptional regulator [Amycolatopsis suaedae]RZQ62426.1 TetR/AcrR family transcriptional regulator [Amycolatopsis suaedae]
MPTRRAETSQESRRLLIEAAVTAFGDRGYRQTTVADIADLAGISRGSIPWHFGSKEGLLLAAVEHTFGRTIDTFPQPQRPGPDGLADLTGRISAFVRLPVTKLLISLLADAMDPDSPIHGQYVDLHRAIRRHAADWAETSLATHELPDGTTPDDIGTLLLGAAIGIHLQWRVAPGDVDLDRAFETLNRVVGAALTPRQASGNAAS